MEQILKIIKQVESTHKGLGVSLTLNLLAVLACKGIFNIASRGSGKGSIINSITHFDQHQDYNVTSWNNMTLHELVEKIGKVNDTILIWKIPEWSTLQRYHRELLLTTGAQLITDGNFYKYMTDKYVIDIQNCSAVLIVGIQPLKLMVLMRESETWESLSTDRFVKLIMINPLRTEKDYTRQPPRYELPDHIFDDSSPTIETDLQITTKLFNMQVSEGRSKQFATDFITGYAKLEGIDKITVRTESKFQMLFGIPLSYYQALTYSYDIDEPDTISAGGLRMIEAIAKHDSMTPNQLAKMFRVYRKKNYSYGKESTNEEEYGVNLSTIYRHAKLLKFSGIIENEKMSDGSVYHLARHIRDYYDYYKRNWT